MTTKTRTLQITTDTDETECGDCEKRRYNDYSGAYFCGVFGPVLEERHTENYNSVFERLQECLAAEKAATQLQRDAYVNSMGAERDELQRKLDDALHTYRCVEETEQYRALAEKLRIAVEELHYIKFHCACNNDLDTCTACKDVQKALARIEKTEPKT